MVIGLGTPWGRVSALAYGNPRCLGAPELYGFFSGILWAFKSNFTADLLPWATFALERHPSPAAWHPFSGMILV